MAPYVHEQLLTDPVGGLENDSDNTAAEVLDGPKVHSILKGLRCTDVSTENPRLVEEKPELEGKSTEEKGCLCAVGNEDVVCVR